MTDTILDLIDNVIGHYESSPDAMRWSPDAPDPTPAESRRPYRVLDESHVFLDPALIFRSTNVEIDVASFMTPLQWATLSAPNIYLGLPERLRPPRLNRASSRNWRRR